MADYQRQEWVDGSKGTPLSAERLNHMEEGIAAAKGARGPKGAKGEPGHPSKADWDALVARVEALEDQVTST